MKKDFLSVTTFAEVLELLGIKKMPTFSGVPVKLKEHFIAHFKAICIAELANDGVPVDWNDSSQNKYLPWFYFGSPSGFSYGDSGYYDSYAYAGGASRTLFISPEAAKRAFEIAPETYEGIANL